MAASDSGDPAGSPCLAVHIALGLEGVFTAPAITKLVLKHSDVYKHNWLCRANLVFCILVLSTRVV